MGVYTVEGMRVLLPTPKVAAKNPDRFATVAGTAFYDEDGQLLSIKSKVLTIEMVNSEGFALDIENSTLTLPDNRRGRPASVGASADDIAAALAAARSGE